jgi:hypothetical protein
MEKTFAKKPTVEYSLSGKRQTTSYTIDGVILHREDGPAYTTSHQNTDSVFMEEYFRNGHSHRVDGPAIIKYDEAGGVDALHFYINGEFLCSYIMPYKFVYIRLRTI